MKKAFSFIIGIIIIIFTNTIFNFIPFTPKPDLILIYVIVLSLYWDDNNYVLCIIAGILGFLVDSSVGRFQGQYTMLFLIIAIVGVLIKDKIRKDFFTVPFFISSLIIVFSAIFNTVVTRVGNIHYGMISTIVNNMIYIMMNIIVLAILIGIINSIERVYGRNR